MLQILETPGYTYNRLRFCRRTTLRMLSGHCELKLTGVAMALQDGICVTECFVFKPDHCLILKAKNANQAPSTEIRLRKRSNCIASFSYRFHVIFVRYEKPVAETYCLRVKIILNNLSLLLYRFQKFALSVKTIGLYDNDIIMRISFSNLSTL